MDTETYITSGAIEAYVMGTASHDEAAILECVMKNNAVVKAAVHEAQHTLEQYATLHGVEPPAHIYGEIKKQLSFDPTTNDGSTASTQKNTEKAADIKKAPMNWYGIAAGLLLLVSATLAYQIGNSAAEVERIAARNTTLAAQNARLKEENSMLQDARKIELRGVNQHPDALAEIYWNDKHEVFLNPKKLPTTPAGKQYQLWAIVEGKPVDLGVYDATSPDKMQAMKPVAAAQAFAVTLEKEGGNPTPTMEEMYVMGEI